MAVANLSPGIALPAVMLRSAGAALDRTPQLWQVLRPLANDEQVEVENGLAHPGSASAP